MTIEGRVEHAAGTPTVTFRDAVGELLAVAADMVKSGGRPADPFGSGRGRKRYRITYADESTVVVDSGDAASTSVRRGDGTAVGTILRAESATAVASTGGTLFHFVRDPCTPPTPELLRLLVLDRSGSEIGCLDVVRAVVDSLSPNGITIHSTRLSVPLSADRTERDILLAACVDITLGSRPYCAELP